VALKTLPRNSSGEPHILEHLALCGSDKYPIRDPFFKMLNRSMASFMNAMTAHSYTMYPFSSENSQDFNNLLSVYMDAVFRPRLNLNDFRQEGWRLEGKDPKGINRELERSDNSSEARVIIETRAKRELLYIL
jgi:Zn-dependent M16 (insulinase) family peptidase